MGSDEGAKAIKRLLLTLASSSFTSIEYWEKQTFGSLKDWKEVMSEKGDDNGG